MKYSLSPREILRALPSGFPSCSGHISSYIPPFITIQIQSTGLQGSSLRWGGTRYIYVRVMYFRREDCFIIVSVLWWEEGYTMKYSLSPREIPRAKPEGFPEGSGYISLYFLTWVKIQTFSITNPALTFLGDQYLKNWFSVLLRQLGNTGKYYPVDWAIRES